MSPKNAAASTTTISGTGNALPARSKLGGGWKRGAIKTLPTAVRYRHSPLTAIRRTGTANRLNHKVKGTRRRYGGAERRPVGGATEHRTGGSVSGQKSGKTGENGKRLGRSSSRPIWTGPPQGPPGRHQQRTSTGRSGGLVQCSPRKLTSNTGRGVPRGAAL